MFERIFQLRFVDVAKRLRLYLKPLARQVVSLLVVNRKHVGAPVVGVLPRRANNRLLCRWSLIGVLSFFATTVAAQSNQPIDIDSSSSFSTPFSDKPIAPTPPGRPDQDWSSKRVQKLAPVAPVAPVAPLSPSRPGPVVLPTVKRSNHLADETSTTQSQPDTAVLPPINAVERRSLGRPTKIPDEPRSNNKLGLGGSKWFFQTIGALAAVFVAILFARAILSRALGRSAVSKSSALLEVLARVNVSPRLQILLIRTGKRVLLVGESSSGLRTLADIQDPEEVAGLLAATAADQSNSISRNFNQLLSRFNGEYGDKQRRLEEGSDAAEHQVDRTRDQISGLVSRIRHLNLGKKGRWV